MPKIITLLTDFGIQDEFVGVMKGVIWSIAPEVNIVDITHAIQPQNIMQGALILGRVYRYFPAGTIHVAVVDPGVGGVRKAVVVRAGESYFIGPDNGLFTIPWQENTDNEVNRLDNPDFQLSKISRTFHGRDIFAPAAAHLSAGISMHEFGESISNIIQVDIQRPLRIGNKIEAEVVLVDSFGNLITNVSMDDLHGAEVEGIRIGGNNIHSLSETFESQPTGKLIAMFDSSGTLSIVVVNGNASRHLSEGVGSKVEIFVK